MEFGLMFFAAFDDSARHQYELILEASRLADDYGLRAVWLPERHFHEFGGLSPNPSVVAAAVAQVTRQVRIRAGSIIPLLHDPIRIAEEWCIVDNLSNGRVAMSFGSGWNARDFVFFPDRYEQRRELMYQQIETVRTLWLGGAITRTSPFGRPLDVRVFPRPVQQDPEIWLTSGGSTATFVAAGAAGAHVLTSLEKTSVGDLAANIVKYRESRRARAHEGTAGRVAVMLHTFVTDDPDAIANQAEPSLCAYLGAALDLELKAAQAGGQTSSQERSDVRSLREDDRRTLLRSAADRYIREASLIGSVEQCLPLVQRLTEAGVDEIACLVDFVRSPAAILAGLARLQELARIANGHLLSSSWG